MESTMNILNRLISGAFNDISRRELLAIRSGGFEDVSVNEAHTVDAIGIYMPKTMSYVADKLDITLGTLTVSINHLVKKGYVNKVRSETDKRVFMLSLFRTHQRFHFELVRSLIMDMSDYEADMFIEALSSLNKFLKGMPLISEQR